MARARCLLSLLCLALSVCNVHTLPSGPPLDAGSMDTICVQMLPRHSGVAPQSGSGGFVIQTTLPLTDRDNSTLPASFSYTAGQTYPVTLVSPAENVDFRGFLVEAHVPGNTLMLIGRFVSLQSNQQLLNCDSTGTSPMATITHSNPQRQGFTEQRFMWEAPDDSNGTVDFRYTVVQRFATFYASQSAAMNQDNTFRLTFRDPQECSQAECDVFVGINTDDTGEYLDIVMEGEANGWIAVGFTQTRDMFGADVVACHRVPSTSMVEILDTWNPTSPRTNNVDAIQDVMSVNSDFVDGRISCRVLKRITSMDTLEDFNLDGDYYVLYGRRRDVPTMAGRLLPHETGAGNPLITQDLLNPRTATDSGTVVEFPRLPLLRLHGILMVVAWILLATSAIFFASFMRPALPNGEWFQVHRAFLLTSMFVGALGFAIAFIANADRPTAGLITLGRDNINGTVHFAIGIIIMVFHIANPIIAIFRCKPDGDRRWIFNFLHGSFVGFFAELLSFVNIGIGTFILFSRATALFWFYIAYIIVFFIFDVVLIAGFTISSCLSSAPNRQKLAPSVTKYLVPKSEQEPQKGIEMAAPGSKDPGPGDSAPAKKQPSADSPFRWASMIVFVVLTASVSIVLIALIAALN